MSRVAKLIKYSFDHIRCLNSSRPNYSSITFLKHRQIIVTNPTSQSKKINTRSRCVGTMRSPRVMYDYIFKVDRFTGFLASSGVSSL